MKRQPKMFTSRRVTGYLEIDRIALPPKSDAKAAKS